jgi:IS5 family transposase
LDDERFFAPFVPFFDLRIGRPSVPMERYPRLMFLKRRYRLGYESLCAEVSDSISWWRFCRIDIDAKVPHPTTLMKITTRCGEQAVEQLNDVLLAKAGEQKLVKTGKVRADTTVVSANVEYPTDSGLLAHAVSKMSRLVERRASGRLTVFVDESPEDVNAVNVANPVGAGAREVRPCRVFGFTVLCPHDRTPGERLVRRQARP